MCVSEQLGVLTKQTSARHPPPRHAPPREGLVWRQHHALPASEPCREQVPASLPQRQPSWGPRQGTCSSTREKDTQAITLVGEDGLGQGGRGGSHGRRGAAGPDARGSRQPRILTDLRRSAESVGERR